MIARLISVASIMHLALLAATPVVAQPAAALPRIKTVDYDAHGAFRVNGKPFFPIALYNAPMDDQTLRELRDFGFNVLTGDAKSSASLPAKGFYSACEADKKVDDLTGVFVAIGVDSPALVFKTNLLMQVAEANAKSRTSVPGRPIMNAIGYWENEPAGVFTGKLPSKAVYEDLVAAIDVSAPYLYPIPYQPVSSVGDAVARARKASHGKKPILPVLQLFIWEAKDRFPTPAELRCMAFLSLVESAHGIAYYTYGSVTGRPKTTTIATAQPDLWKSVKKLNQDIADLGPRLLAGTETNDFTVGKGTPAVKMKLVREKDSTLAVIVNSAPTRQEVKLLGQPRTAGRMFLRNGKQVDVNAGVATLALEPFGVEVLRWVGTTHN
jgi:hypothetical protein